MKKPFRMALAGAFGSRREQDDKVRLLSVVSRSSLSDDRPLVSEESSNDTQEEDSPRPVAPERRDPTVTVDYVDGATPKPPIKAKATGRKSQEWVFTLYDFDGKGTPNREDILSVVRAIYEVLGNAKIRATRCSDGGESCSGSLGAFKIKLSLSADDGGEELSGDAEQRRQRRAKRQPTTSRSAGGGDDGGEMKEPEETPPFISERRSGVILLGGRRGEELPLLRHHKKAAKRQRGIAERHTPPPPLPNRKIHRRNGNSCQIQHQTTSPDAAACASCTYRDYVNLSELENCCSSNAQHNSHHHHSGQEQKTPGCGGRVVHHIRHCDRHCHCPPPAPQTGQTGYYRYDAKTGIYNFCLAPGQQQQPSQNHTQMKSPSQPQHCSSPATSSMRVNVPTRMPHRTPLTPLRDNRLSDMFLHEDTDKKAKLRNRNSTYSDEKTLNDCLSTIRGIADGSDRMFVEHKHIHKHYHHYHHHYC